MNQRIDDTIRELEQFMAGRDDALAIPREAGEFLHALILATGVKHAVEIGTSYGYSALWIASALADNGGRLVSIDQDARKTESARATLASAGLSSQVDLITGKALDVLPSLEGSVELLLSDADKPNCIRYVELVAGRMPARAIVLTDNTVSHPEQLADFVAWIRKNSEFRSVCVPVGNGMEMSVKLAGG